MKRTLFTLVLSALLVTACMRNSSTGIQTSDEFPVYTAADGFDPQTNTHTMIAKVVKMVPLKSSLPVQKKLQILADSLSVLEFNHLVIDIRGIDSSSGERIANIELIENPRYNGPGSVPSYQSWYDFFQGSYGGLTTTVSLRETFLQKNYAGTWIDGVCFFYQGDSMKLMDHVNLHGLIKR